MWDLLMTCPVSLIMLGESGFPSLLAEYEAFGSRCGHCAAVCPGDVIAGNFQMPLQKMTQPISVRSALVLSQKEKITRIFEMPPASYMLTPKTLSDTQTASLP